MAKNRPTSQRSVKEKTSLAKRDKPKDPDILKTITHKGKRMDVKRQHITEIYAVPARDIVRSCG